MKTISNTPDLKTLTSCLEYLKSEGFTEDFKVTGEELFALNSKQTYHPEQIKVVNFYRFEGPSNPDDSAILYALQTDDGSKGTLIDAYGVYSDDEVGRFMLDIEKIQKSPAKE